MLPCAARTEKDDKYYTFYTDLEEEDGVGAEARQLFEKVFENMINKFASTVFTKGVLSIDDGVQIITNYQQNYHNRQGPESCTETIQILRESLFSAMSVHQSFVSDTLEREKIDRRRQGELKKRIKHLEIEKREWKGKREEIVRSLSLMNERENILIDEMEDVQTELKIAKTRGEKSRKVAAEYLTALKKAQKEASELKEELRNKHSRLESLEKQLKSQEVREYQKEHSNLEKSNQKQLTDREKFKGTDFEEVVAQLKAKKKSCSMLEQRLNEEQMERVATSAQLMAVAKEQIRVEEQMSKANEAIQVELNKKLSEQKRLCEMTKNELGESHQTIVGLKEEIEALKHALKGGFQQGNNQVKQLSELKGEIGAMKGRLKHEEQRSMAVEKDYNEKLKKLEEEIRVQHDSFQDERRRLHNMIQELRGNVRVFARIRPFLPADGVEDDALPCIMPKNNKELKLRLDKDKSWQHKFGFDAVFPPTAGQDVVFNEVSEFIQSALDGHNVCLFSYGQTSSGKTHTMQGSGIGQMRGIIPRAIEQVGKSKVKLEDNGWSYEMEVSYLEIYNETIRDLLQDDMGKKVKHNIKETKDGKRYVSNLTMKQIDPNDKDAVDIIMRHAAMHRSVASTGMNSLSSRSHAVFTLYLKAINPKQGQTLRGQLNLVDLAGSERLNRSNASGERAKESMAINKSLSSLTDVFAAIGRKGGHVPFRNSKLTYLLQPCLSGNGKTLMIVNLSPTEASSQESLCSLRFASQVNKCELGKAKRSIENYVSTNDENPRGINRDAGAAAKGDSRTFKSQTSLSSMNSGTSKSRNIQGGSKTKLGPTKVSSIKTRNIPPCSKNTKSSIVGSNALGSKTKNTNLHERLVSSVSRSQRSSNSTIAGSQPSKGAMPQHEDNKSTSSAHVFASSASVSERRKKRKMSNIVIY